MIILSGITGFLGSNIARSLIKNKKKVLGIINSDKNQSRINDIKNKCSLINADEIDEISAEYASAIEGIVHTATVYGKNNETKSEIYNCNYDLPIKLLHLAESSNFNFFINIDTFYNKNISFETNLNHYVASKKELRNKLKNTYTNDKYKIFNLILHHLYGPGDSNDKFIIELIKSLMRNEAIELTSCNQQRDFIHVEDAINAIQLIISNIIKFRGNFIEQDIATGNEVKLKDFINLCHSYLNSKSELLYGKLQHRKGEIMEIRTDIKKLKDIGWDLKYDNKSGIQNLITKHQWMT